MAYLDRELGVWRAKDGTSGFSSQAEAEEYEETGVRGQTNDTSGFSNVYDSFGLQPNEAAQAEQQRIFDERQQQIIDDQQHNLRVEHFKGNGNSFTENVVGGGYQDGKGFVKAPTKNATDHLNDLARFGTAGVSTFYGAGINQGLKAVGAGEVARAVVNPLEYGTSAVVDEGADQAIPGGSGLYGDNLLPGRDGTGRDIAGPGQRIGGPLSGGGAGAGGAVSPGTDSIRVGGGPLSGGGGAAGGAGGAGSYADDVASDQTARDADKVSLTDLYNDAKFDGSEEARQSREQQQQALSKQAELYSMLASFDPDAYAQRSSELAMKNQLALAKSIPGGASAGADGMFAALEAAPGINAEAQRDGQAQLLQRQQLAAQVTGQMGDLASTTRQQDVGEDQLKSEFGIKIADGISQVTGLDWQLDSNESKSLATVALALDAQNIDWARLDLDGQIAEADRILAEAGLAQQWRIFKAGSELSEKDLYGGLLSILGTGLGGLFQIQAAKAGAK